MQFFQMVFNKFNPIIVFNHPIKVFKAFFFRNTHPIFRNIPRNIVVAIFQTHSDIINSSWIDFPTPVWIDAFFWPIVASEQIPWFSNRPDFFSCRNGLNPHWLVIITANKIHGIVQEDVLVTSFCHRSQISFFKHRDKLIRESPFNSTI